MAAWVADNTTRLWGTTGNGMGANRSGANGDDAVLKVPAGTEVLDEDSGAELAEFLSTIAPMTFSESPALLS